MHNHAITAVPLPATTSRAEWLQQRREGIGSSDASAILGLSNWESPYSLWEIKTGKAPLDPPVDDRTRELREWGNRLEPIILEAVSDRLGINLFKPEVGYRHPEREWQRANLDAWDHSQGRPGEFKTADPSQRHLWIGQIPDHAEVQTHHTAAVTGATHAIVAGLVGGNQLYVHEIEINPNVVEMITEAEAQFWHHVQTDTPPPLDGHVRTLEALTREWSHKPGSAEVARTEVEDWWRIALEAAEAENAAKTRKKEAHAHLARLMDGHDRLTTGDRVWATTRRGRMSLARLEADHPELVAEYTLSKPVFDLDAFKVEQPDIYRKYQSVSINPRKED